MTTPLPLDVSINPGDAGHLQMHDDLSTYVNAVATKNHRLISRSFDGRYVNGTFQPNAGQLYVAKMELPYNSSVSTVEVSVATGGTGGSPANWYTGLYDSTGARIGISTEQHLAWATNGIKVCPLVGGPFLLAGGPGAYCFAVFLIGTQSTTKVAFAESSGQGDDQSLNFDQLRPPYNAAVGATGQSSLPSSLGSVSSSSALILCGLS